MQHHSQLEKILQQAIDALNSSMNRPAKGAPSSLAYLIWDYLFHIEYHLAQIIPDYKKLVSSTYQE